MSKPSTPTGAPEMPTDSEKIEVTPEMIEAGVLPLLRYHPDRNSEDDIVREIYRAMAAVSRNRERAAQ